MTCQTVFSKMLNADTTLSWHREWRETEAASELRRCQQVTSSGTLRALSIYRQLPCRENERASFIHILLQDRTEATRVMEAKEKVKGGQIWTQEGLSELSVAMEREDWGRGGSQRNNGRAVVDRPRLVSGREVMLQWWCTDESRK
jgi:hypothetical protein